VKTYNIHEAKTQLSRLVQDAALGTPQVLVQAFDAPRQPRRVGFLAQEDIRVPDDFDTMGADEIAAMFAADGLDGESDVEAVGA